MKTLTAKLDYHISSGTMKQDEEYRIIHEFKSNEFRSGVAVVVEGRFDWDDDEYDTNVHVFDKETFFK